MTSFNQIVKRANIDTLQSGDVLFLESKFSNWYDRVLKFFSRSKFTHTAMLVDIKGSWFVVEARPKIQQKQYQVMPADWWVEQNKDNKAYFGKMPNADKNTIRDQKELEKKIKQTILNPKWSLRPYSYLWIAVAYLLQEWFGIKRPSFMRSSDESKNPLMCSVLVQEAWEKAGVIEKGNFQCPGDIENLVAMQNTITPLSLSSPTRQEIEHKQNSNFFPDNYKISRFSMAS